MYKFISIVLMVISAAIGAAGMYFYLESNPKLSEDLPLPARPGSTTIANRESAEAYPESFTMQLDAFRRAENDPIAAVQHAKDIRDRDERYVYLDNVWETWGGKDGLNAAQWANDNLSSNEESDALIAIARGWSNRTPLQAADWLRENTEGSVLEDTLKEVLTNWGSQDPNGALTWTTNLDASVRSTVMNALAKGWAATDPSRAVETGMSLLDQDYGNQFVMTAASKWALQDPIEASKWAEKLGDGELKLVSVNSVGTEWGLIDPEAASEWVESLDNDESKQIATQGLVSGWSEHDPGSALLWTTENLPKTSNRRLIIEDVMLSWATQSPREAGEWINSNSSNPALDDIVTSFTYSILERDPYAALEWTQTIQNGTKRLQHTRRVFGDIKLSNPTLAEQWVQGSELTAQEKAFVLE